MTPQGQRSSTGLRPAPARFPPRVGLRERSIVISLNSNFLCHFSVFPQPSVHVKCGVIAHLNVIVVTCPHLSINISCKNCFGGCHVLNYVRVAELCQQSNTVRYFCVDGQHEQVKNELRCSSGTSVPVTFS